MTNKSFIFEVDGIKYIIRIPGECTNELINRSNEYEVYNVINTTGTLLPSTGGIGTTLFVVVGTIMVLSLGTVLVSKYRMSKFNA